MFFVVGILGRLCGVIFESYVIVYKGFILDFFCIIKYLFIG